MTKIINAEQMAEAHPDTFSILTRTERENIKVGASVKIAIEHDEGPGERFWVTVKDRVAGNYSVIVDNNLLTVEWPLGHPLTIGPEHVYSVLS